MSWVPDTNIYFSPLTTLKTKEFGTFVENEEHLCDTGYSISIETALFAYLVDYIDEKCDKEIEITYDKLKGLYRKFVNYGGKLMRLAFNEYYYEKYMEKLYKIGWVKKGNDVGQYCAIMDQFVNGWDNLSQEELEFVRYCSVLAKRWCLFCNLQIDFRILDDHYVADMLQLRFLYSDSFWSTPDMKKENGIQGKSLKLKK